MLQREKHARHQIHAFMVILEVTADSDTTGFGETDTCIPEQEL